MRTYLFLLFSSGILLSCNDQSQKTASPAESLEEEQAENIPPPKPLFTDTTAAIFLKSPIVLISRNN
ncbi:MAG: hypothetical protein WDO71_26010 [Bacteroidota bacterium]